MKENTIIFLFIYLLFFPNVIWASKKDDRNCPSAMAHLKLVKNNNSNPIEKINSPKNRRDPFWTYPSEVKLQLIKCALRYEVEVDLRTALQKAGSPEKFADMLPPIGFNGKEFVGKHDVMLIWIINQLSNHNQNVKLRIMRTIYKAIFQEEPAVDTMFPDLPLPVIQQHFDSILRFLLQYQETGSLPDIDSFHLEHVQQKTEEEKVEDRVKIINQLFAL